MDNYVENKLLTDVQPSIHAASNKMLIRKAKKYPLKNNILYVAEGENNKYLYSDSCIIDNLVINYDKKITNCKAKFRYRSKDIPVTLEYLNNNEIQVKYENGKSITPGQVCALYLEDRLIGSGIIKEVRKNNEKLWYLL